VKLVTAAIITRDRKVLIARRGPGEKLAGSWEFPGGKVEDGESLQDCLVREMREELGVTVVVGEVVAETEYHYAHGAFRLVGLRTSLIDGEFKLTVHDRIEWVPTEDLLSYALLPADLPIAQRVQELIHEL
jgi:8-oxo-dGTP diphosphatase